MRKKIDYAALALQVVADECKKSFFYFVQTFWDVIIQEKPVYNWHIPYLCDELQTLSVSIVSRQPKLYDLIINIPPGTTKSTIVTIMFPAWLWVVDPSIRIITNSYSGELSIEHATKSKDIIQSEKYRKLFPEVVLRRDKSAKSSYENTKKGARYTTSTGGTITGKHAHVIINDDPVNPRQADSEPLRKQGNDHTKTLSTRKVNKENTPVITIMQRLHEDDVTGYLLKKKGDSIRHICLPAEDSENVKPASVRKNYINGLLDPVRLSRKVLEEAKTDLGSRGYAGQYEQTPTSDEGNIVKKEWFRSIAYSQFLAIRGNTPIHFFLDTAFDEKNQKTDNDPSGIIATCRIQNNLYVFAAQKVYKKLPDLVRFLPAFAKAHGYSSRSTLRIEPKANGKSVVDVLKEASTLNVTETPCPEDSKATRLNAVSPKIECGRVILVEGDWNEEFIEEVCGFPAKTHDEYVDILCYAINYHLGDDDVDLPENLDKSMFGL